MTDELTRFMLTSVTGIAREKRRSGTDSDTVVERTKCLLNTNCIEPLSAELSEIQSRSFTIQFNIENQLNSCFMEKPILAKIQKHRNLILSTIIQSTAKALLLIRDGILERIMSLLHKTFFEQFSHLNTVSERISRDSNPIPIALSSLFGAHKTALAMDRKEKAQDHK